MTDEQIISTLGLEGASAEKQQELIDSIRRTIDLRVIGLVGEMISDEQEAKFDELIAAGDNQAIWDWLRTDVVGVDTREIYEATLQDYLDNYKKNEFIV